MKGVRALTSGMLVLVAICAVPAISAAQDAGTPASPTTTTTATTPADPATPTDLSGSPGTEPTPSGRPGAGTPGEPRDESRTGDPVIGDSPPATGPPGGGGAKAHKSASATVTMGDFFFSPASVSVAVGDTVTWRNNGQAPHNATGDGGSFSTPNIDNGESTSHTFTSAGTFSYICTIHPQMKGTVRVLSSGGGGGSAGSTSSGSGTSEASAVASPDAAGSSSTLPMTGMAVGALALVGLALLASGLLVRSTGDRRRGWLSIF